MKLVKHWELRLNIKQLEEPKGIVIGTEHRKVSLITSNKLTN